MPRAKGNLLCGAFAFGGKVRTARMMSLPIKTTVRTEFLAVTKKMRSNARVLPQALGRSIFAQLCS